MPLSVTSTAGGTAYVDIRVGDSHNVHQVLLDVSALAASADDDGYLAPGFAVASDGSAAHAIGTVYALIGPEPVKLGDADHFGNAFLDGTFNGDAIAANVGSAIAGTLPDAIRVL